MYLSYKKQQYRYTFKKRNKNIYGKQSPKKQEYIKQLTFKIMNFLF